MKQAKIERTEHVYFRYWRGVRHGLVPPAREIADSRVTARSYIASKIAIAARALRGPFISDTDRQNCITVACA